MERIVPGLLIAGVWFLLLLKGSILLFNIFVSVLVLLAADEYVKMADTRQLPVLERVTLGGVVSLPLLLTCIFQSQAQIPGLLVLSFAVLTSYFFYRYKSIEDCYTLFCKYVFGSVYVGVLGAHLVLLRQFPEGGSWLIIVSAITACSDTGAYFVGRAFGKKKLCPNISPNKTVEGAAGGLFAGILSALFFAFLLLESFSVFVLILVAALLTVIGIAGDLTESIIKRGTGTKDSGRCLAGHGGILDRIDSLLFAGPVLYYLLVYSVV